MEENKESIRKILEKASSHETPSDMANRVLSAWKKEQTVTKAIPPLISRPVWALIIISVLGSFYWVFRNSNGASPRTPVGEFMQGLDFGLSLDAFQIQPVMLLSITALAVMIGINVLIMTGGWRTRHFSML